MSNSAVSNTDNSAQSVNLKWRVVDIAVASVIGVASAVIYWIAALLYTPLSGLEALVPGILGLMNGLWLFAAPLAAVIIRKPGAALYAEVVAALLEALIGNQWGGVQTLLIALAQGAAVEIVFIVVAYKVWNASLVTLSGALSGLACWAYTFFTNLQGITWDSSYGLLNLITTLISGAVISGILMWYLYKAIARTGALDRFESGRIVRQTEKQAENQAASQAENA